jgi:ATP-binding cassette subfamily C protein CydD
MPRSRFAAAPWRCCASPSCRRRCWSCSRRLGVAMVAAYVGFHLLGTLGFGSWGRQLSLGEGLFVLLLAPAFFEPLRELSAVWHDRAAGEAALGSLDRLQRNAVPLPGASASPTRAVGRRLGAAPAWSSTTCISPAGRSARGIRRLRAARRAGEHVALTGASGVGKTALLSLIAGLVPAIRGEISIGGVTLNDATPWPPCASAWRGWARRRTCSRARSRPTSRSGAHGVGAPQVRTAMRFASLEEVAQAHPATALGEGGQRPVGWRGRAAGAGAHRRATRMPTCCWSTNPPRTSTPRPPSAWPMR